MQRRTLIIVIASVIVLALAGGAIWFFVGKADRDASAAYDSAYERVAAAPLAAGSSRDRVVAAVEVSGTAVSGADALVAAAQWGRVADPATIGAVSEASAALTALVGTEIAALSDIPADSAPGDREDRLAAAVELEALIAPLEKESEAFVAQAEPLEAGVAAITTATSALLASAQQLGTEVPALGLASTETATAYTNAVAALTGDGDPVTLLGAYQQAWSDSVASHETALRAQGSVAEPTYIRGVLVVNKTYPLPSNYGTGLTAETSNAFASMQAAAKAQGLNIFVASGFRSYSSQTAIYNRYVSNEGVDGADRHSARPGHSEHQSGLTFDLNSITESFGSTPAGIWVAEHAHEYGFIVRYPQGKEAVTGYVWEPWHLRYLGTAVATDVHASGLTLEEYLGVSSAY